MPTNPTVNVVIINILTFLLGAESDIEEVLLENQSIPHCHYTPEEREHNSVDRSVDISDNGDCKCVYSEAEVSCGRMCSSIDTLGVKQRVVSPGYSAWII